MKSSACKAGLALLLLGNLLGAAVADTLEEIDTFDRAALTPRGRETLEWPGIRWRHAQTEHFVLHFERKIFAQKVARMAEFLYRYISDDLSGPEDRVRGRSHIFIFRNPKRWRVFQQRAGQGEGGWAFSFVEGSVMYLQQAKDTPSSGGVLAHEMTHLVLNRFFRRRPPLWLNEGLAEWYGLFGRAAFKGVKKSRRGAFSRLSQALPLNVLLTSETYPAPGQVRAFYDTARFLVGFLRLDYPPEKWNAFIDAVLSGADPQKALQDTYGFADRTSLRRAFDKFVH